MSSLIKKNSLNFSCKARLLILLLLTCSFQQLIQPVFASSEDEILSQAKSGDAESQYWVARNFHSGSGEFEQDYKKALEWYEKAAENGHTKSMIALGNLYQQGQGASQSYTHALEWYEKAANNNDPLSMFIVGSFYSQGKGVTKNASAAVKWYRKAAELGHPESQFNLANHYFRGEGVNQNYDEALKWLKKSAENGQSAAQFDLAAIYINGEAGIEKNPVLGYVWMNLAAKNGNDPNAAKYSDLIEKQLNENELKQAKMMIEEKLAE